MPTIPTPNFLAYLQQLLGSAIPSSESDPRRTANIDLPVAAQDRMPPAWSPQLERQIETVANRYGIDPAMADRLVRAESSYNPMAVGTSGERGLTQLMPGTALEMGVTDPSDPEQSLQGGFGYLRKLIDRYEGDTHKALMAYNWGPGKVAKAIRATKPLTGKAAQGQARARAYASKVGGKRD